MIKTLRHYTLKEMLGTGGMGRIYLAHDDSLDRDVAIKILHHHLVERKDCLERFLREAKAAAKLNHKNVVTIHEVGKDNQDYFIVMEYAKGKTLGDIIDEQKSLNKSQVVDIAVQLLDAMQYCHSYGIIHRDIKPENILLTDDGEIKVLDFGIVHFKDANLASLTSENQTLGTIQYMAPEQILGEELDERCDVFAAGIVIYEMLTGQLPFDGENPALIVYKQLNEEPIPPSYINPDVSSRLEKIILKSLHKEKERRYKSAADFLDVLVGYQEEIRFNELAAKLGKQAVPRLTVGLSKEAKEDDLYDELDGGFHPKFVGREKELEFIQSMLLKAFNGSGSTLVIEGPAGIGKTTLANKLQSFAKSNGGWSLEGKCLYSEGLEPYAPFVDSIRRFFLADKYELPLEERNKLKDYIRVNAPSLAEFTERIDTTLIFDKIEKSEGHSSVEHSSRNKEKILQEISGLMLTISKIKPLLLFLDDIQWADEASIKLMHFMARQFEGEQILFVITHRSDENGISGIKDMVAVNDTLKRMNRERLIEKISLNELTREESNKLIDLVFHKSHFTQDFYEMIYNRTKGNPFFSLETLKLLKDNGIIVTQDGIWSHADTMVLDSVPEKVEDLLTRRLKGLSYENLEILQIASVIGQKFDSSTLSELLGIKKISLLKKLYQIERDYKIIHSSDHMYHFDHPMLRDSIYYELSPELRSEYHRLIGEHLTKLYRGDFGSKSGEIASHLMKGGNFDLAAPLLFKAAVRAFNLHSYREASYYFESFQEALEQVSQFEPSNEMMKEFRLKAGICYRELAKWDRAIEKLEELLNVCKRENDLEYKLEALDNLGFLYYEKRDWEKALELFSECLENIEAEDNLNMKCRVLNHLGIISFEKGDLEKSLDNYNASLQLAERLNDNFMKSRLFNNIGLIYQLQGNFENAIESYEQVVTLCKELSDERFLAGVYNNIGMTQADQGRNEESTSTFKRGLEIAAQAKDEKRKGLLSLNLGKTSINRGGCASARKAIDTALITFEKFEDKLGIAECFHILGLISTFENDYEKAEKFFQESVKLNSDFNYPEGLAETYLSFGNMFDLSGNSRRALDFYNKSQDIFERLGIEFKRAQVNEKINKLAS